MLENLRLDQINNNGVYSYSYLTLGALVPCTLEKYKVIDKVHEKGYKNKPLTEEQKANNTEKSRVRVRVEHVFGFMENSMGSMYYRKIGIKRAKTVIGLMNLTYNVFRKIQLATV